MKNYLLVFIAMVFLGLPARAADVRLKWDPSTDNPAGYKLHYGLYDPATKIINFTDTADAGKLTEHTLTGLAENKTYVIAATAYNANQNESGYSNKLIYTVEVSTVITVPGTPKTLTIVFE